MINVAQGVSMKKWAIAVGIVILLSGLVAISFGNQSKVDTIESNKTVEKQWSISDTFAKGLNITVDFQQSYDWSLEFFEISDDPPYHRKYLWVNVTDTVANTNTTFKVTLVVPRGIVGEAIYTSRLEVYPPVNVTQHGATIVEDQPEVNPDYGINLGVTRNDGLYIVTLAFDPQFAIVLDKEPSGKPYTHPPGPPAVLRVHKVSEQTNYPYTFLLPVGASLGVIGIALPVWGAKSSKRKAIRKERNASKV